MKKLKKPPRKLVKTTVKEDTAKLLLDVGKLVLGSVVIGTALRYDFPSDLVLTVGAAIVILAFIIGIIMGRRELNSGRTEKPRRRRQSLRRRKK